MLYYDLCIFGFVLSDLNIFASGLLEFVVPQADASSFFSISVSFMATHTFSDLKVCMFLFLFWHSNLLGAVM